MIEAIIRFSIHNKLVIGLLTLALIGVGSYSLIRLPIDAVPDITNNQVQIVTTAPTLGAEEMERLVTAPIEYALATLPDKSELRSISRSGLSVITVVFHDEVDINLARQMVSERLKLAETEISSVANPGMMPITTGLGEIYQYVLYAEPPYDKQYDAMALRTMQDWIVRRQLLGTEGIADVSTLGGFLKQYEVTFEPERLRAAGVSVDELIAALENNNENTGGAYLEKSHQAFFIRGIGMAKTQADLEQAVVHSDGGVPVRVADVAKVQLGSAARFGAMTRNGEGEVVGGIVLMLKGANSSVTIGNVKEKIAEIQKTLPQGVKIEPFLDRTRLVNAAIGTVAKNLVEGALIVIFVLVLMLGDLRAGLLVASVIPLAMLFAISCMQLLGISGNLMSLGAIDFGIIVDGSVIIVEAVLHRLQHAPATHRIKGSNALSMNSLVYESTKSIAGAAVFGIIIILIVFMPIMALTGVEGRMFRPMAQTVSLAILGAFLLSLTYIPMAATLVLKRDFGHKANFSDKLMTFIERLYKPTLVLALRHKVALLSAAVAGLLLAGWMFTRLGGEFIPRLDEGDFALEVRLPPGVSLAQSVETTTRVSEILLAKFPEVQQCVGKIGSSEIPTDPMPIEACDLMVVLKDKDEWTSAETKEELAEKMGEALSVLPGVAIGFMQPIEMRFNELMTGSKQDVAIQIFGEDLDQLSATANDISRLIEPVAGVKDVYVETVTGLPQMQVIYDRARLAQYGLSVAEANRTLRTAFAGTTAGLLFDGEKRFDVVVRMDSASRRSEAVLQTLPLVTANGSFIPLNQVAEVGMHPAPAQISRENARRRITVAFNVRGRDVESVVNEIRGLTDTKLTLPPGYSVTFGGQFENLIAAKARLMVAVPVALLLIFVLLFFAFGSLKQSLLIFSAIPLAAIGGVMALTIRGMAFSISAGVGFIALFGVAVLNGIVMLSYFEQLRREGFEEVHGRVVRGTLVRLRPVLMTALVASLGFLPMAISSGAGAEVQKPLATVVIGGLVTATLLTLLVLPVLYAWVYGKRKPVVFKSLSVFLLIGVVFTALQAQPVDSCIAAALQRHPGIKAAQLGAEAAQHRAKANSAFAPTDFSTNIGQYNSPYADVSVGASQAWMPMQFRAQRMLAQAEAQVASLGVSLTQNDLRLSVRYAYHALAFTVALGKTLESQDSLLKVLLDQAGARVRAGESPQLDLTRATLALEENKAALAANARDLTYARSLLQNLCGMTLTTAEFPAYSPVAGAESPLLAVSRGIEQVAVQQMEAAKAQGQPSFTGGLYNQSLTAPDLGISFGSRFTYLQAGVSLPLDRRAIREGQAAAALQHNQAQAQTETIALTLSRERDSLASVQERFAIQLRYCQQQAMPLADEMIRQAMARYRLGEASYSEYVQVMREYIAIRLQTLFYQKESADVAAKLLHVSGL